MIKMMMMMITTMIKPGLGPVYSKITLKLEAFKSGENKAAKKTWDTGSGLEHGWSMKS